VNGAIVLVIDDDEALVALATTILNAAGFPTWGTTKPHEALRWIGANPSIKVLISDVMMPEITGPELVRRAQRIRHGRLRVLFMTGGFDGVQFRKADRILEKPWTSEELLHETRRTLSDVPSDVPWDGPERRNRRAA